MNIEEELKKEIRNALKDLYAIEIEDTDITLQPTRKDFTGSHTLVTFPFLKASKQSPEDTGNAIGQYVKTKNSLVSDYNVVKGFLNFTLAHGTWIQCLTDISDDSDYGQFPVNGKKVMVEYSSPNTNKPLHLGHLRNNFIGYSVAEILKTCGYEVQKVQIINDRGIHICKSMVAYRKYGDGETPETAGIKGDHLIGKYYVKYDQVYKEQIAELTETLGDRKKAEKEAPILLEAQDELKNWEKGDETTVNLWKKMNGWVYDGFNATYDRMGVDFDKFYYESDTYLLGKDLIDEGLSSGVFYKNEDGSVWVDLEDEGLDKKLLLRSDGTAVYMTQDLGTADSRHNDYPFEKSIYVVGNEQDYHFKVLFLILKKLGRDYASGLHHLSYGMVDLPSGKMKSREGTVVDADELMDQMTEKARIKTEELGKIEGFDKEQAQQLYHTLGIGALKYFLLKVDPKKRMLFNPEESIEFHGNTGPFIQYTYARISAILRRAGESGVKLNIDPAATLRPQETELIRLLVQFPRTVMEAGNNYAPSLIAQYVYDLAKEYNRFYTELSIFGESDPKIMSLRVVISKEVARVLKSGLSLLGIQAPDRM